MLVFDDRFQAESGWNISYILCSFYLSGSRFLVLAYSTETVKWLAASPIFM
jgi:hypothetical protein